MKSDRGKFQGVMLEPDMNVRSKIHNSFGLNKKTLKNRTFMIGFSKLRGL
jgi:hypothetical protein